MYSRQESSETRKKFWTSFGQYMRPVTGANGDRINWVNYKTGRKHIYFRMDVDNKKASIAIELQHSDPAQRVECFEQFVQLKNILEDITTEKWNWEKEHKDEHGQVIGRIVKTLDGVNIFNQEDWPSIISFLKPRMIALDEFWQMAKDGFE